MAMNAGFATLPNQQQGGMPQQGGQPPMQGGEEEKPSKVIHFRNVTNEITQADLQNLCSPFGTVENIVMLRDKNQGLLQMDSQTSATNIIRYYQQGYTDIGGRRVYLKFSRHQELQDKSPQGPILLVSLTNPVYDVRTAIPVTADLLYRVFSQYGTVLKIVIVAKRTSESRVQALVQFDGAQTAGRVKSQLQGQNVFVGQSTYFTLDIQFSNLQDLTVKQNSRWAMEFSTSQPAQPQQLQTQQVQQVQPQAAQSTTMTAAQAQPATLFYVPQQQAPTGVPMAPMQVPQQGVPATSGFAPPNAYTNVTGVPQPPQAQQIGQPRNLGYQ